MRRAITLALLFSIVPTLAWAVCANPDPAIARAIQALTVDTPRDSIAREFNVFTTQPRQAACQLVGELQPVDARIIMPDHIAQFRDAMHVIWALRALRYITGCQDFRAPTQERFAAGRGRDMAGIRAEFLTRGDVHNVPFFAVWMSRDIIFIAAPDAQSAIVRQWRTWLSRDQTFVFGPCLDFDKWYF
jgi:hypothetical protein